MTLRIGLSACFFHGDPQRAIFKGKTLQYLEQSLAHWILKESGVLAYLIPAPAENSATQLTDFVNDLDALVLQGGSDVSPKTYGESPLRPEWNGDYVRDCYEISLLREFMTQGKPVLGICRGAQLINVAFGGSLYQDIQTQVPGALNHRNWDIYDQNFHEITIAAGTGLERLYPGVSSATVNTIHHQALKALGENLIAEARSKSDGIVEAIRLDSRQYVVAVQWHPEFHDPKNRSLLDGTPIVREFLETARKQKRNRSC